MGLDLSLVVLSHFFNAVGKVNNIHDWQINIDIIFFNNAPLFFQKSRIGEPISFCPVGEGCVTV
jgi:hypothetical protein